MNKESFAIYSAGLIQGVALVVFPAASTLLTNPHDFNFSSTVYGSLFIPQFIFSILAAALNPMLSRNWGSKCVFLMGIVANFLSLFLLAFSAIIMKDFMTSYITLLFATGCLGLGFGLIVPTLNSMAALLHPDKIDSILLILNALLGFGTALAPLFTAIFVALGFWWGLPLFLCFFLICLFLYSYPLKLPGGKISISVNSSCNGIPNRFWIFAAFALLYGIIETLNGNWISIYMDKHLHASIQIQAIALTAFWGMVTFGRVFFAAARNFFSEQTIFQIAPFITTLAFIIIALLPSNHEYWAVAAFGLTGFGCSVLLPLIISFGNKQLNSIASSIPGMIISFYLLGYGIAAFGVGPLQDIAHISLRIIYGLGSIVGLILGIISLFIIQTKKRII